MTKNELLVCLWLFVRPIIAGLINGPILWYLVFYRFNISIVEADESAFTDTGIPVLAMFHAIIAGHVLVKVWDEHKLVRRCIREDDRDSFVQCMDDRIPKVIHMLLGSLSVIIISLTLLVHFEGPLAGIALNFSVAFVLGLYWEVATNLDNPSKGVWYVGRIPKEWLDS